MRYTALGGVVLLALALALPAGADVPAARAKAGVVRVPFGNTGDGKAVGLYVLTNSKGMTVKVMTYGAAITELWVPDRDGKLADVTLGFDNIKGYQGPGNPYFGCVVGRYANRIAKGEFALEGKTYKLAINNPPNHLHGGKVGFDKRVWKGDISKKAKVGAVFARISPDKEESY